MGEDPSNGPKARAPFEGVQLQQTRWTPFSIFLRVVVVLVAIAALVLAGGLILFSVLTRTKGRPLRGRGRSPRDPAESHARSEAEAAAGAWRRMAAEEYESIACFGELALDLMAAGAPPSLVRRTHEAALEEEQHAALCLAIAEQLDGRPASPPQVEGLRRARRRPRWRTALLVRLAAESYVDGWIGEASSSRALAQVRRQTEDDRIRDGLERLAREEMGHARLGGDIVDWCLREGGPVVERALAIVRARALRADHRYAAGAADLRLRRFGVLDDALRSEARAWAKARDLEPPTRADRAA